MKKKIQSRLSDELLQEVAWVQYDLNNLDIEGKFNDHDNEEEMQDFLFKVEDLLCDIALETVHDKKTK